MYNETDIQRHRQRAGAFKTLSGWWHSLGGVFFKALLVFVVLDLFMIAAPNAFGRDFMLLYVLLTVAMLMGHVFCAIQAKRYHAKRTVEETYIAKNDYTNINEEN